MAFFLTTVCRGEEGGFGCWLSAALTQLTDRHKQIVPNLVLKVVSNRRGVSNDGRGEAQW